jgi:hypothetical protein
MRKQLHRHSQPSCRPTPVANRRSAPCRCLSTTTAGNPRQTLFAIGDRSLHTRVVVPKFASSEYHHVTPHGWVFLVPVDLGPSSRTTPACGIPGVPDRREVSLSPMERESATSPRRAHRRVLRRARAEHARAGVPLLPRRGQPVVHTHASVRRRRRRAAGAAGVHDCPEDRHQPDGRGGRQVLFPREGTSAGRHRQRRVKLPCCPPLDSGHVFKSHYSHVFKSC